MASEWDRHPRNLIDARSRLHEERANLEMERNAERLAEHLAVTLHEALVAISDLAEDEIFWSALHEAGEELTVEQVDKLIVLAGYELEPLLNLYGYASPPPPPVKELVERMQYALVTAAEAMREGEVTGEELGDARHYLRFFVKRSMRQLHYDFAPRHRNLVLRSVSERTLDLLGYLIPVAASVGGGAVGGLIGGAVAGGAAGFAVEVSKSVGGDAAKKGAASMIGFVRARLLNEEPRSYPKVSVPAGLLAALWVQTEHLGSLAREWERERSVVERYGGSTESIDTRWRKLIDRDILSSFGAFAAYIGSLQNEGRFSQRQADRAHMFDPTLHSLREAPDPRTAMATVDELLDMIREYASEEPRASGEGKHSVPW